MRAAATAAGCSSPPPPAARRGRRRLRAASTAAGTPPPQRFLYLGLDVGTQSTKAVLYCSTTREVVGRGSVSYALVSDRPGQAEQLPQTWIEVSTGSTVHASKAAHSLNPLNVVPPPSATSTCSPPALQACKDSIADALADAGSNGGGGGVGARVAAIGVSGQQHGLVALDADCQVIRPGGGAPASERLLCFVVLTCSHPALIRHSPPFLLPSSQAVV